MQAKKQQLLALSGGQQKVSQADKKAIKQGKQEGYSANVASAATGPLHPSWAAKKQQRIAISQTAPKGKKVVFND